MVDEREERKGPEEVSEKKDTDESGNEWIKSSQSASEDAMNEGAYEKISEYVKEQSDKTNIYIQYRLYNNHGVVVGDEAQFESIYFGSDMPRQSSQKGNVFTDKDGLSKWFNDNYASYSMALMLAAAVFDSLPYTWVIWAAERFYESFEHAEEKGNIYAQGEVLRQFGAEICKGEMNTYAGTTPIDIVLLADPEHRETILKYVWRQYPQLQHKIVSWLQSYNTHRPISMSKRAVDTIGFLACEDFFYFLNEIVPKISEDASISTDMMVGQILIQLNQMDEHKKNVYNLLCAWSREKRIHNQLTALFVCAQLNDKSDLIRDIVESYIQRTLREIRENSSLKYRAELYDFLGAGIRSFTFYRLLIETLEEVATAGISQRQRWDVYGLFLSLFAIDVSQARPRKGDEAVFIKLCMVKHPVSEKLRVLWRMVWECGRYRQLLYDLMAAYDAKVAGTDSRYGVERFVDKILGDIYPKEKRQDICSKIHRRVRNA